MRFFDFLRAVLDVPRRALARAKNFFFAQAVRLDSEAEHAILGGDIASYQPEAQLRRVFERREDAERYAEEIPVLTLIQELEDTGAGLEDAILYGVFVVYDDRP